jgi:MFS superfamily sulfate permease-like transporter
MNFFRKGDSLKIGIVAICVLALCVTSLYLGIVFGLAWSVGFLNGRDCPYDETKISD